MPSQLIDEQEDGVLIFIMTLMPRQSVLKPCMAEASMRENYDVNEGDVFLLKKDSLGEATLIPMQMRIENWNGKQYLVRVNEPMRPITIATPEGVAPVHPELAYVQ